MTTPKIETTYSSANNTTEFKFVLDQFTKQQIMDQAAEAVKEIARQYVATNIDKITAKLDLTGLSNLIAIYAARKLAETVKEEER